MHSHTASLIGDAAGIAAAALAIAFLVAWCWRFRYMAPRLAKSAIAGALAGGMLTGYAYITSRVPLAHAARAGHLSPRSIYGYAFLAAFLAVTGTAFVIGSVWSRSRRRRYPGAVTGYQRGPVTAWGDRW